MLQNRNICGWAIAGLVLAIYATSVRADNAPADPLAKDTKAATVKNVSLKLNSDCNQTAATTPKCNTYKPCICYCGCCDCCGPKVSQVLKVKDPCDCCCCPCLVEIPVCLPACCKNPCVDCRCGLFGRGVVTYSYDCGCCVTIVFRRCGDVLVKYSG